MLDHKLPSDWPCPGVALASTMALMTQWAAPCSHCVGGAGIEALRSSLAAKISGNLRLLQQHPGVALGLRQAAAQLQGQWQTLVGTASVPASLSLRPVALH